MRADLSTLLYRQLVFYMILLAVHKLSHSKSSCDKPDRNLHFLT